MSNLVRNIIRQSLSLKLGIQSYRNVTVFTQTFICSQRGNLLRDINLISSRCRQYVFKNYSSIPAPQYNNDYCKEHNIQIIGTNVPVPITDIDSSDLPDDIKQFLTKKGFLEPTFIQAQGWPIALTGQNLVGIAQTGTGKTLAFLIPAIIRLKQQEEKRTRGPKVLVLAPTRELAKQIEEVAKDFYRTFNVRSLCIYGGASKMNQASILRTGVDILVATPGRLNDFIDTGTVDLSKCSYVVLDEADRMLDMGFEPQIRKVLANIPKERQMLMFSATWPEDVKDLARDYLGEFVQINVGSTDLSANKNIKQHIYVCEDSQKMEKFESIMNEICSKEHGKVLVFSNMKSTVDHLVYVLNQNGHRAQGIHGNRTQSQRDYIISKFKQENPKILVATEVAARGLDVSGITHVVNFDFPNMCEDYIHRIGRTGRKNKGEAHSIFTKENAGQAQSLINILKEANQEVPEELLDLQGSQRSNKYGFNKYSQQKSFSNNRGYYNRNGYSNRNNYNNRSGYSERNEYAGNSNDWKRGKENRSSYSKGKGSYDSSWY